MSGQNGKLIEISKSITHLNHSVWQASSLIHARQCCKCF